nr:MAG TPA: Thymidine kinase [Caudoviricetes sp.]
MEVLVMNFVLTLLLALVAVGTAYAFIGVNNLKNRASTEIDKIDDENTKLLLSNALNRVDVLIIDQIDDLSDLITKELENIKNSGKVPTLEDIQNTVEKIKDSTIENLDTAVITVLKEQTIDIEDYVKNMVERVIEENFIEE